MAVLESAAVTDLEEQSGGNGDQNLEPMDSSNIVCNELPVDLIDLVLSFLPIPDLCRVQVVCKRWHALVRNPNFHELCHRNGNHHEYLFMWRHLYGRFGVDPLFVRTLSFLDVGARRWYSIPSAEHPGLETLFMGMHDGVVCKFAAPPLGIVGELVFAISNPVSKRERILPAGVPKIFSSTRPKPILVPMVDDVSGILKKMFLILGHARGNEQHVYLHDTTTGEWREILDTPHEVHSAVSLHGNLYTTARVHCPWESDQSDDSHNKFQEFVVTSSYNEHEDKWTEVSRMSFGDHTRMVTNPPRLVVSGNRLFVNIYLQWGSYIDAVPVPVQSISLFDTMPDYRGSLQQMYEISIPENERKPVVQFTCSELGRMFGDVTEDPNVFPCFDSNGVCKSLVLVSQYSWRIIKYDLATEEYIDLPQHPLAPIPGGPRAADPRLGFQMFYNTTNMRLSLRNL